MNEEKTGKCLPQVEHICGHLWHRYSITVNQVMVATVKFSKWWLNLIKRNFCRVHIRKLVLLTFSLFTWTSVRCSIYMQLPMQLSAFITYYNDKEYIIFQELSKPKIHFRLKQILKYLWTKPMSIYKNYCFKKKNHGIPSYYHL
jgi:hypothetical protein